MKKTRKTKPYSEISENSRKAIRETAAKWSSEKLASGERKMLTFTGKAETIEQISEAIDFAKTNHNLKTKLAALEFICKEFLKEKKN